MVKGAKRNRGRTVHARALEVVEKQRQKMCDNLGLAIDGRDPEGVHDMRVASRRLRAALQAFGPWLNPKAVRRALASLRRLTRTLGTVRDLDILRLRLQQLSSEAALESRLAIELVDSRLARKQLRARRRMFRDLASIDVDALERRLRGLVGARPAWQPTRTPTDVGAELRWPASPKKAPADQPILSLLEALEPQIIKNVRKVTAPEIPGNVGSHESSQALHEIRVRGKKLRYQLEIIQPFIGPEGARVIATLRGLQDHLGDYHDDVVLDGVLEKHISRHSRSEHTSVARELEALRAQRGALLDSDERACRQTLEKLYEDGFAETVAVILAHAREKAAANARRPRAHQTPRRHSATGSPRLPAARPRLVRLPQPAANEATAEPAQESSGDEPTSAETQAAVQRPQLLKRND